MMMSPLRLTAAAEPGECQRHHQTVPGSFRANRGGEVQGDAQRSEQSWSQQSLQKETHQEQNQG